MTKTVLILGASGKIGSHAARAFKSAGWTVRNYDRKSNDMTTAAKGADVIVNGLNPPNYHNWAKIIPEITEQVIAAAKASGATVFIPGNVYNYGTAPGPWSEKTPQSAVSRKGQIRIEMEESYRRAGVQTIILRGGNFIDPDQNGDIMSMLLMPKIGKGKLTTMGAIDVKQSYCYLPDWARAVVMLAERRAELQNFEDVPYPGTTFTMEQLRASLESILDKNLRFARFPWWAMTLAAPFWELAREVKEMRYLWNTDHQIDNVKFDRLLPDFKATDVTTIMAAGLPRDVYPNKTVPGSISLSLT